MATTLFDLIFRLAQSRQKQRRAEENHQRKAQQKRPLLPEQLPERNRILSGSFAHDGARPRPATSGAWRDAASANRPRRRGVSSRRRAAVFQFCVPVPLVRLLVRRENVRVFPRKDFSRDFLQPVQAFAQARTDGFRIQLQRRAQFLVTQVAEIAQLDDFAARLAELVERFAHQPGCSAFIRNSSGPGASGRRIGRQSGFGIFGLQRNRRLAAAAFGRRPLFADNRAPCSRRCGTARSGTGFRRGRNRGF